jgi:CrcB protein
MANPLILILAFGAAAFLGGMLRSLLAQWFPARVGTFVANVLASFAAGMAIGFTTAIDDPETSNFLMPVVATGFAGALSTWSTLAAELSALIKSKRWRTLAFNLGLTLAVGIIFAHRGAVWARRIYYVE